MSPEMGTRSLSPTEIWLETKEQDNMGQLVNLLSRLERHSADLNYGSIKFFFFLVSIKCI